MMSIIFDWIAAARPKTLGAALAPVAVGCALAQRISGSLSWRLAFFTLAACLALQIATNFFNDLLDAQKGADTRARLGPQRMTATGVIGVSTMRIAAWGTLVLAAVLSLPLIEARGMPILFIGLPSLYFCFGYTGGPLPLAYHGLGELFVILFFGFIAVIGTAFVQTGEWFLDALAAGAQIGCLSTVLIAINNLRDVEEDTRSDKRTLAVRFGVPFARWEVVVLILAAHAFGCHWFAHGWERAFTLPLLTLPIGLFITWRILVEPPSRGHNRLLALSGIQLLLFAALLCWGIVSSPL
ncbi:MAG: 1,4-dihydroxy-2-naphthoate octaprenyltransferase [Verrucomicrobiaceae bacterium]|nr:1,4-dihydroxy-2-naphthoate octaprenyltransferase [Verrucomicrobiaceae bacterium]